jgi:hypothetical protein
MSTDCYLVWKLRTRSFIPRPCCCGEQIDCGVIDRVHITFTNSTALNNNTVVYQKSAGGHIMEEGPVKNRQCECTNPGPLPLE